MNKFLYLILFLTINLQVWSQVNQKNSTLYFYRPFIPYGLAVKIDIYIENNLVGNISNNGKFIYTITTPGRIKIKSKGSGILYKKFTDIEINIESGNNYFFKVAWDATALLAPQTIVYPVSYSEVANKFPQLNNQGSIDLSQNETINQPVKDSPTITTQKPDVDNNIPLSKIQNSHAYALIIGNEDYSSYQTDLNSEVNVKFAINDANSFMNYCNKTIGVPKENIRLLFNATLGQMKQSLSWISKIIEKEMGNAEVYFYYAGHGLPNEETREPYIIPVDISGNDIESAILLKDVYAALSKSPTKKTVVFLDACFSGGARNSGLIATRGIKVKPKDNLLDGNILVFCSCSDNQSALPYNEKQHGIFTYFLLKKIQETKGDISYFDLYKFLKKEVDLNCVKINNKEQTPNILSSINIGEKWKEWKFK